MLYPVGLETWELIALAGLYAAGFFSFAATIGLTVAYIATRERAAEQPATAQPAAPVTEPAHATRPATTVASAH